MIEPEAESQAVTQRSLELAQLLDAGHPVVEGIPEVWAERKRLAALTHQARRDAAVRSAADLLADPGVTIGRQPPLRRVETDARGRDLDPFHGASVITPDLVRFWEHQRDVVGPAVEGAYRQAAVDTPYRQELVFAAREVIGRQQLRHSMLKEGGAELEAALTAYEDAYVNLRQAAVDAQVLAGEAVERLASLRRIEAQAVVGDGDQIEGFLASAIASALPEVPIAVDAKTDTPLVPVSPGSRR